MNRTRRPLALSNWKMAMTVVESLAFVREFESLTGRLMDGVDVVICPPYTALYPVAQALRESRLHLGGQDVAPSSDLARTGQVSARLLADVGCQWVMLGHWEIRRHQGDDDDSVNRKVHLALESGLRPILLIGESQKERDAPEPALERHLERVLDGCNAEQVATMALVYEPEGAIGVAEPAAPDHVAAGCACMRDWVRRQWGEMVADGVRIIYGGSVAPEHALALLAAPDLDGLGASRQGRDPRSFVEIVRQIVKAKLLS